MYARRSEPLIVSFARCPAVVSGTVLGGLGLLGGYMLAYYIADYNCGNCDGGQTHDEQYRIWSQYTSYIGGILGFAIGALIPLCYRPRHNEALLIEPQVDPAAHSNIHQPVYESGTIVINMPISAEPNAISQNNPGNQEIKPQKTMHERYVATGGNVADIPSAFIDVVTGDIIENPYLTNTGVTLGLKTIESIQSIGNGLCPTTRKRIKDYIHNNTVEIIIRDFVERQEKYFKKTQDFKQEEEKKLEQPASSFAQSATPITNAANWGLNLFPVNLDNRRSSLTERLLPTLNS